MTRKPRHTCGVPTGQGKHEPHCTAEWRKSEGCWCFLAAGDPALSARKWRARRRQVQASRRRCDIATKRYGRRAALAMVYGW